MRPNLPCLTVSENLLQESTQTIFSLEPVLFFYMATFVAGIVFWTLGVLLFGRKKKRVPSPSRARQTSAREDQRITPVVS